MTITLIGDKTSFAREEGKHRQKQILILRPVMKDTHFLLSMREIKLWFWGHILLLETNENGAPRETFPVFNEILYVRNLKNLY